jgi:hypothetical protein
MTGNALANRHRWVTTTAPAGLPWTSRVGLVNPDNELLHLRRTASHEGPEIKNGTALAGRGPRRSGTRSRPLSPRCLRIILALRPIDCHVITSATALSGRVPCGVDAGLRAGTTKHPGEGPSCAPAEDFPGLHLSANPAARNRD